MWAKFKNWIKDKWIKTKRLVLIVFGVGIATAATIAAPVVPVDMIWVKSYETLAFNTSSKDIHINNYAFTEDRLGYYIRTKSRDEAQFERVDLDYDISGLKETIINGVACYGEFFDKKSKIVRVKTDCNEYKKLRIIKKYPQPKRTEHTNLLSSLPANALDTITFDAISADTAENSTSLTFSHTVTSSGSNRTVFVGTGTHDSNEADRDVTSVTYDAEALTQDGESDQNESNCDCEAGYWYRINPSTGANNVVITTNGTSESISAGIMSFTNVDQTDPTDSANGSAIGDSDTVTVDVTTNTNGAWVIDSAASWYFKDFTSGSGQTERWYETPGFDIDAFGSTEGPVVTAATVTMDWDIDSFDSPWATYAIGVKPSDSGSPPAAAASIESDLIIFQ